MKKVNKKLVDRLTVMLLSMSFLLLGWGNINHIYAKECILVINKSKNSVEGLYVLNSCENGRFKISITKKANAYSYSILDGKKIISKGKVFIRSEEGETIIVFGNIAGLYTKNNITVQNYGNSMNEYNHFTQCDQKYLLFIKNDKTR